MSQPTSSEADGLSQVRRESIDALVELLADESLAVEEFDRRVRQVRDAGTLDEVRSALAGLPGRGIGLG